MDIDKEKYTTTKRAQYFLDHFRKMPYRAIATEFGWINEGETENLAIRRGVYRVKNLRKSLKVKLKISLIKRDDLSTISDNELNIPSDLIKDKKDVIAPSGDGDKRDSLQTSTSQENKNLSNKPDAGEVKADTNKPRHGLPREGYNRRTLIVRDDYFNRLKETCDETGKTIREIMDEILSDYFR